MSQRALDQRVPNEVPGSSARMHPHARPQELVGTEEALMAALGPLARAAREQGVEIVCEIVPGVGAMLVVDRRTLVKALVRSVTKVLARPGIREVRVRLARQRAGFALSDNVLLTVSSNEASDEMQIELKMPAAQDDDAQARPAEGVRLLMVSPSAEAARVLVHDARRCGAAALSVNDRSTACAELRAAHAGGRAYDLVLIDDALPETRELVDALRDDASLGGPPSVVATVPDSGTPELPGVSALLAKPVLPTDLGATVARVLMRGPGPSTRRRPRGPMSVLVGEDDIFAAKVTRRLLEQMGHRVTVETSGKRVLERLGDEAFDAVLLDVGLPDLDGIAVARALRERRELGVDGPSIVLVASAAPIASSVRDDAGVDAVLRKPLDLDKLGEHIPHAERRYESCTRLVAVRSSTPAILDVAQLRTRAGGDDELVRELLTDFLVHSERWALTLHEAARGFAFAEVSRLAHRLRGALGALGAAAAAVAAENVERYASMAASAKPSEDARTRLAGAIPDLDRRVSDVRAAASTYLATPA